MSRGEEKTKRPRFAIRDILLITALVGITVAWSVDRSRQSRKVQKLENDVEKLTDLVLNLRAFLENYEFQRA
jgi:hypothetical protein